MKHMSCTSLNHEVTGIDGSRRRQAPAVLQCRQDQRQEVDVDVCRRQAPGDYHDELDRRGAHCDGAMPQQRWGDLCCRLRGTLGLVASMQTDAWLRWQDRLE